MCEDWMVECPRCSVLLNVAVWLSFFTICWCSADTATYNGLVSPQNLVALPVVLFLLLYASYIAECYFASSRKFLSKAVNGENILQLVDRLRSASPEINFKAVCWHHEPRTRMIPVVDRRGKTRMQNETYREKVITLEDSEKFNFQRWTDVTEVPDSINRYGLAVIAFTKSFQFTDSPSQTLFTNLSCGFQARNRHKDKYMDFEEVLEIEGFTDHVIAYVDLEEKQGWMNIWCYWVCSVFLMSWLFRWLLKRRIFSSPIHLVKNIQVFTPPPSVDPAGQTGQHFKI